MVRCIECNGGENREHMTKTVINLHDGTLRVYRCHVCGKQYSEEQLSRELPWIRRQRWTFKQEGH